MDDANEPWSRPSDRGIAWRLGVVSLLFFLVLTHGHFYGSDEVGVFETTRSLYEQGTLAIPPIPFSFRGADGRSFSQYAVGQSVLALPFYALGHLAAAILPSRAVAILSGMQMVNGAIRYGGTVEIFAASLYSSFASALLLVLFFVFERDLGTSRRNAVLSAVLVGSSTYVAMMSTYFLRHATEAAMILGAFLFLHRFKLNGELRNLWFGASFASAILLIRFPAGVAGLAIGSYAIWCLYVRGGGLSSQARSLCALLLPLLVSVAISGAVNFAKWGSPWNLQLATSGGLFSTPLRVSLHGFLLSPGNSIFVFSPLLCLAPWSLSLLWRRHRAEAAAFLFLMVSFLLCFGMWHQWTGLWSSPGPRYLFAPGVLCLLSLGPWMDARRELKARVPLIGLAIAGACIQLSFVATDWAAMPQVMGYAPFQGRWDFLFSPAWSPPVGAIRMLLDGRFIDLWLWRVAAGRPGVPAAPIAALVILAVWSSMFAWSVLGLLKAVRRGESAAL